MGTFSNTWRHIRRSPYQAFAAISVMTLTFLVSGMFFLLSVGSTIVLKYFEQKPQIIIFFKDTKKEADVNELQDRLKLMDKVASVKFVSKEDALAIYKEQYKNDPLLLEMVSADILPPSLEIYASKPEYLADIANFLNKQPNVDEVNFQKNIVERLVSLTTVLRQTSIAVFTFLIITTIVVLMTTTAFKIALKKDEIELLQLLGATRWYIQKPFLEEGIIFGFIASTLAFLSLSLLYLSLNGFLSSYLSTIPPLAFYGLSTLRLYVWPPNIEFVILIYFITVFFGMIIGFIGTMMASSKYIK